MRVSPSGRTLWLKVPEVCLGGGWGFFWLGTILVAHACALCVGRAPSCVQRKLEPPVATHCESVRNGWDHLWFRGLAADHMLTRRYRQEWWLGRRASNGLTAITCV